MSVTSAAAPARGTKEAALFAVPYQTETLAASPMPRVKRRPEKVAVRRATAAVGAAAKVAGAESVGTRTGAVRETLPSETASTAT